MESRESEAPAIGNSTETATTVNLTVVEPGCDGEEVPTPQTSDKNELSPEYLRTLKKGDYSEVQWNTLLADVDRFLPLFEVDLKQSNFPLRIYSRDLNEEKSELTLRYPFLPAELKEQPHSELLAGQSFVQRSMRFLSIVKAVKLCHGLSDPVFDLNVSPDAIFCMGNETNIAVLHSFEIRALKTPHLRYSAFRAPEVVRSPASDVFSLGHLLHFLWTGKFWVPPVEDYSVAGFVDDRAKPMSTLWSLQPQEAAHARMTLLIQRCMHTDPVIRPDLSTLINEVEEITMEAVLFDPRALSFWKLEFPHAFRVPHDVFVPAFLKALNLTERAKNTKHFEIQETAFRFLLGENSEFTHLEELSRLLFWFGPLKEDEDEEENILYRIEYQLAKKAFHGPITAKDADGLLQKPPAHYLLRFSGTVPGCYTVSWTRGLQDGTSTIQHMRFTYSNGKFNGKGPFTFDSLEALLKHLHDDEPSTKGCMKNPVEGSKYSKMFRAYKAVHIDYKMNFHYAHET